MITVAEFRTTQQLRELRMLWTELWLKTKNASFFQSYDWYAARWNQLGNDESPAVFAVSIAGKPVGILPWSRCTAAAGFGRIRRLTDGSANWSAFNRPIGPNPTATLAAVMRHLKNNRRDWDVIDLRHIDGDGSDRGRTANAMRTVGLRHRAAAGDRTASVLMNVNWPEYWASRPRELHREYHLAEQRLAAFGEVRYARFRPLPGADNPRWDLFSAFLRANRDGMFPDSGARRPALTKSQQAVLSKVHESAVQAGAVDLNLLYVNNRPTAAAYSFVSDGRVEGVQFGIATDATTDAATVLFGMMLRDSFERDDTFYRFPVGDESTTTGWANHFETSRRLTHYPALGVRGQLARLSDWLNESPPRNTRTPESIHVPVPPPKTPVAAGVNQDREFAVVG